MTDETSTPTAGADPAAPSPVAGAAPAPMNDRSQAGPAVDVLRPPGPGQVRREAAAERVPGTDIAMRRFPSGVLRGQPWIDATGDPVFGEMLNSDRAIREIAFAVSQWAQDAQLPGRGNSDAYAVFSRDSYVAPSNIFDQMRLGMKATEDDDVVGGLADTTEGLAFNELHWESPNFDDTDVYNQWAAMVNLDEFARQCWRDLFSCSTYVAAAWWGFKDFKVRGRNEPKVKAGEPDPITGVPTKEIDLGNKRRQEYPSVYCPVALTTLDPTRVIPVGNLMFGQETLVWAANAAEMSAWEFINSGVLGAAASDPMMTRLFVGQYTPTAADESWIRELRINPERLLILNPQYVWRHTLTRQHYRPFADVRMKRVFPWLDMKRQQMNADRVALVGNANYILLVKKGEKDNPATEEELTDLNNNFQYVAKLPVIIGDHTMTIDIVTPKVDHTLDQARYGVINVSIVSSLLSTFASGQHDSRADTTYTMARTVARGLANRRHGIRRDWEKNLSRAIFEHPFNDGKFEEEPDLAFSPRNINLETDQPTMQALIALLQRGDLSRMTMLEEVGLDEDIESKRRLQERKHYDMIFESSTPFNGAPDDQQGGIGGGALPPGAGGGGRPPAKAPAKATKATSTSTARKPRGKNRTGAAT